MPSPSDIAAVIAALENGPNLVLPLVREVPEALLKRRPLANKWSAHEHACHLATVHPIFFERLESMLNDPAPKIVPFLPETDQQDGSLLDLDLGEQLGRYAEDRRMLLQKLRSLDPEAWARTAEHGEYSHYSIFIMFRHLALHDLLHAYRIEEILLKKDWPSEAV